MYLFLKVRTMQPKWNEADLLERMSSLIKHTNRRSCIHKNDKNTNFFIAVYLLLCRLFSSLKEGFAGSLKWRWMGKRQHNCKIFYCSYIFWFHIGFIPDVVDNKKSEAHLTISGVIRIFPNSSYFSEIFLHEITMS